MPLSDYQQDLKSVVMYNANLLNTIANYLISHYIQCINDELPDVPDFRDIDSYFAQLLGELHSQQIDKIESRRKSVEKIRNYGVIVIGDISLDKGG